MVPIATPYHREHPHYFFSTDLFLNGGSLWWCPAAHFWCERGRMRMGDLSDLRPCGRSSPLETAHLRKWCHPGHHGISAVAYQRRGAEAEVVNEHQEQRAGPRQAWIRRLPPVLQGHAWSWHGIIIAMRPCHEGPPRNKWTAMHLSRTLFFSSFFPPSFLPLNHS